MHLTNGEGERQCEGDDDPNGGRRPAAMHMTL
jgi:hypothetical protein